MSDRYDWLYSEDDPDRGSASPATSTKAPDLPPPVLPPAGRGGKGGRGGGRPPKRRRGPIRRFVRLISLLLFAWVLWLVGVPLWAYQSVSTVDAAPASRPAEQPGTTWLLVGSDSRRGLTAEERKELSTGGDGGGNGRTDTILLLHSGAGPSVLTSIPRDSLVPIEGYGTTKINAAYAYGGAELLVRTIEQNTGIRVDGYVEIGFGGLVKVVDAVGGVTICPKEDLKDKDSGLDVKKGCQTADGKTALAYSRARHPYATQDIQRVQSQREVLSGIAAEAKSPSTFINPFRWWNVNNGAASAVQIGDDVGPYSLVKFGLALSSAMAGEGLSCTVPLADFSVRWDAERSAAFFTAIKTDRTQDLGGLCTQDGLPKKG